MIQNIAPGKVDINFQNKIIEAEDKVIIVDGDRLLIKSDAQEGENYFFNYEELQGITQTNASPVLYLCSIDESFYYLYMGKFLEDTIDGAEWIGRRDLYNGSDNLAAYLTFTACHFYDWLKNNQFCGKCGLALNHRIEERVLTCSCGMISYPRINPVVIVCIYDGDKILLTKYANSSYDRYALVAGFVEIGESFEMAVEREVFEEVGIHVKNIEYFSSQPWGISGGLMAGYFAELDGDNRIRLDTEELKEATWMTREEMPFVDENEKSLTRSLMYEWFKNR